MKSLICLGVNIIILLSFFQCSIQAQSFRQLMDSTNYYLDEQADYQTALEWAIKAEAKAKEEFGEMDTNYVYALRSYYSCIYRSGHYDSSLVEYAKKAKNIIKELTGEENGYYLELLNDVGVYYFALRDYSNAKPIFIQSSDLARRLFRNDHYELARSIHSLASVYNATGEIDNAEPLFIEALEITRRLDDSEQVNLDYYIISLANLYKTKGDYEKAEPLFNEALELNRYKFMGDHPELAETINNIAIFYLESRDFSKAESYFIEALEMRKRLFPNNHHQIAISIQNLAYFYNEIGDYEKAEPLFKESLEIYRVIHKDDHYNLAIMINNLASFYQSIGNLEKAETLYKEALDMSKRLFKDNHVDLVSFIDNLAYFYLTKGDYEKAKPLFEESLEIRKRIYNDDHPQLARSIFNMARFYNSIGDYLKAEPFYKEALEMARHFYKTDHPQLGLIIISMANLYEEIGNYAKAESLCVEALEMSRRMYKVDHPNLAVGIIGLANFYNGIGDYSKAEPLYKEALEMTRRIYKGDEPQLAAFMLAFAAFYLNICDYSKSEPLFKEGLEMMRRIYKSDHPILARSISNVASFFKAIGDYKTAESLFKEALDISRQIFKGNNLDVALKLGYLASLYSTIGDNTKADSLYNESLMMYRSICNGDNLYLAANINNLAYHYNSIGNNIKAEPLFKEALEMYRRLFKNDHPQLAMSIHNMAYFYHSNGEYSKAEPLYNDALNMIRRLHINENPDEADCIKNMADLYYNMSDYKKAEQLFEEEIEIHKNIFENQTTFLSEREKKLFWNTMSNRFEKFNTFALKRFKENPTILSNMYDIQLFTKGLLINSANNIKNRILNSGDSALVAQYQRWSDMRQFLVLLYKMTNDELKKKNFDIDSIENVANDLEKQISLKSEDFKLSYERKKIDWKLVKGFLKPDEAAVEVVRFRYQDKKRWTDTICYAFLIVSDQTEEHPDLVLLENGKELENEYFKDYREHIRERTADNLSFSRYWSSLYEKLKGYKKIYFSADGIYNKLNPATLMLPDGRYLLDNQEIQQVNSTKDLLMGYYRKKDESNTYNNAVLVGNPNFGLTEEEVREVSKKIRGEYEEEKIYDLIATTRGLLLTKLPGTEKEVKDIEKLFKTRKWDVKTYLGNMAVKSAVKSAQSPRVLHIATHGLFLEDVKRGGKDIFGFEEKKMVENPLLRSGLFFSGAENLIRKESESYIEEDNGLLTAYEAMNLDLDKTELVVLSACETGLGDVQNGEGVFGLRRAFQQAGAKTVVMSLWSVSDKATQELMSGFYRNWVGGMTKREAFAKAQQAIKSKYKHPYFWGAFVMVGE